jgi:hypothetical protein
MVIRKQVLISNDDLRKPDVNSSNIQKVQIFGCSLVTESNLPVQPSSGSLKVYNGGKCAEYFGLKSEL